MGVKFHAIVNATFIDSFITSPCRPVNFKLKKMSLGSQFTCIGITPPLPKEFAHSPFIIPILFSVCIFLYLISCLSFKNFVPISSFIITMGKSKSNVVFFNMLRFISPIISNKISLSFLTPDSEVYSSIINFNTSSEKLIIFSSPIFL